MFKFIFKKGPAVMRILIFLLAVLSAPNSRAFLSEILEAKKKVEGISTSLKSLTDTLEDLGAFKDVEKEYQSYEKELKEFQRTLNEYERLGIDVRDFSELKNYNPNSIKGQIDFFRNYVRKTHNILKSFKALMESPESITATQQIETNRTLRALLEDSQTRELRKLRREIAGKKILLERRKKEQEFINKQYAYINRHSKRKGFGIFHPFQNKEEKKKRKRKKFLGIF